MVNNIQAGPLIYTLSSKHQKKKKNEGREGLLMVKWLKDIMNLIFGNNQSDAVYIKRRY